jgi:hypothetical protein
MTLWQKKFYYLPENDYVCDLLKFLHEPRNCGLHRLFCISVYCIELHPERCKKNKDCQYDRMYMFCHLWYFQRYALAGNHPERTHLFYSDLLSFVR